MFKKTRGVKCESDPVCSRKKSKDTCTVLSVDFDALLPSIGEMGRYQLVLYLLMCIPATLPAAFMAFNQVFLSAVPQHWCTVSSLLSTNLSVSEIKKLSIPLRHTTTRSCESFVTPMVIEDVDIQYLRYSVE